MADKDKDIVLERLTDIPSEIFNEKIGLNPFLYLIDYDIRHAWCRETSIKPGLWSGYDRSIGQCAVTALLIQDLFGGDIMKCNIPAFGAHYWNRHRMAFGKSIDIDLTRDQFPKGLVIVPNDSGDRKSMLYSTNDKQFKTSQRYRLLRDRFLKNFIKG